MPSRSKISVATCCGALLAVATAFAAPPVVLDENGVAKLREVAFQAARDGDVETLAAYFEAGRPIDVRNGRGDTLLILATYYGRRDAAALILKQPGVEPDALNAMGFTALTGAAFKGDAATARLLLRHGADPNGAAGAGRTPLMFAALFGRTEVATLLIENGADVSRADAAGQTALSLSAAQGNVEMTDLLRTGLAGKRALKRRPLEPVEAPKPA